jgi:hypothetical protein
LSIMFTTSACSRACSTNEGDKECVQDIGGKSIRKETTRKT